MPRKEMAGTGKKHLVYNDLLQANYVDYDPIQPKAEERMFLRRAEKPPLIPEDNVVEMPVMPRVAINEINLKALQVWLDHLGEALYNPITAVGDNFTDGGIRSRCLWELGEKTMRVVKGSESIFNVKDPAHTHFRINGMKQKQYYPTLHPVQSVLKNWFKTQEGMYWQDTIDTPMSLRDIITTMDSYPYRVPAIDAIVKDTDVKHKRILDIGCGTGWASLLLWEHGVDEITAIDVHLASVQIFHALCERRLNPWHDPKYILVKVANAFTFELNTKVDIVLMMNVFHHLLTENNDRAWQLLNRYINDGCIVYLMSRAFNEVYKEYGDDIKKALEHRTSTAAQLIYKYGGRELYRIGGLPHE